MARTFTSKERSTFEQICKLKQNSILIMMRHFLTNKYGKDNVIINPAFLIAKGTIPVALVAHADTVFKAPPRLFFYDQEANVMWSPQGMGADDRAGIYSIIRIVASGLRPHIIITTDEEHGCIGSGKLIAKYREHPFDNLNFLIQLDRRGTKDSVFYDCANVEFEKFVNDFGFETAYGSFTDISVIAPVWKVAAVNFSVGYEDEHSFQERLDVGAMFDTIEKVSNILTHVQNEGCKTFEYIEDLYHYPYPYPYSGENYSYSHAGYWYDDGYNLTKVNHNETCCFCGDSLSKTEMLPLYFNDEDTPFYLCNECYSKNYEDIEWCSKCHKGWFLTKDERADIDTAGNRINWLCRQCKEDKGTNVRGNPEAGKSSLVLLTKDQKSADRQINGGLGESKRENDFGNEWAGL